MKSIRHFLTLLLISSLTLIIFSAAIQGYRSSMSKSTEMFDAQLQLLHSNLSIAYANAHKLDVHHPGLAIQVWQDDQLIMTTDHTSGTALSAFETGFSDNNFSNQRWRVYSRAIDNSNTWLMVGQPLADRIDLAESMILAAMVPLIVSLPILAIVVFFSVSRGLKPLQALNENLSARQGNDLTRVNLRDVPLELGSVVTTLNSVFARLSSAFDREQQFASNAAHELRTPLSVLKINLHNLSQDFPAQNGRIGSLQQDVDRMIHVVNQILLLSRTNPEFFKSQRDCIDLYLVAQQVIADNYAKIEAKQQSIELDGDSCPIISTEFTLYTLLQNLIGNAAKYSPEQGQILVSVRSVHQQVQLVVEDSGDGIPEQEFEQVLKRFYRSQHNTLRSQEGSGLGLAIVAQIMELHHGKLQLSRSDLGGLKVTLLLPMDDAETHSAIRT